MSELTHPAPAVVSAIFISSGHAGDDRLRLRLLLTQTGNFKLELIICDCASLEYGICFDVHASAKLAVPVRHESDMRKAVARASGGCTVIYPPASYLQHPMAIERMSKFMMLYPEYHFCFTCWQAAGRDAPPRSGTALDMPSIPAIMMFRTIVLWTMREDLLSRAAAGSPAPFIATAIYNAGCVSMSSEAGIHWR